MQPISLVQIGHFNNLDTDNFEELIWLVKMNNPAFEFEIVKDQECFQESTHAFHQSDARYFVQLHDCKG